MSGFQYLVQCYLKGSLSYSLEPEDAKTMTWDIQKAFLDATIHNQLLQNYPVNNEFSKLFFKKFISLIEPYQEVHDECYNFLCSVMKHEVSNSFCYRHYVINNNSQCIITIKETNNMVVNGTTGMRTWEAALMLADWALSNKDVFEGKKVLELGSGVGFTAITIAKQCNIKSIVLSDCHSDVLNTIKNNIKINFPDLNKAELNSDVMMIDWHDVENPSDDLIPDIVIGADIVYDPSILQPLCNIIKRFFNKNNELEVYIASMIRNEETFDRFLDTLVSNDLKFFKLPHKTSMFVEWDCNNEKMCLLKIKKSNI